MAKRRPPAADRSAPFLTIKGAADRVGLTEGAVRAAIKRGELELVPTACGLARLLRMEDVEGWTPPRRGPRGSAGGR